ncbi:N-acetylglucosamine-6-phosphate deacetylase [Aestuariivirga litoralis]|uniref:N-acetylglucosamine-6-phosphate deacetylase n=1 Tax=Aestuariivirga litoralis TaxID=2650924 RepID=UPI0018C84A88|nr:N-acetylglucosamine-6-phosphate deacetylase [Aestuariivirga litoralis]MBG1233870.1 N-acetylglucosamine-6-phosphate deacetylase [Aestuariivirga litoralis]
MATFLKAKRIFTGAKMLEGHGVLLDGKQIVDVLPVKSAPLDSITLDLGSCLLAPGFIDIQVNGGGGVNLNDTPNADGVRQMARAHRRFGTTGMLPTVITDTPDIQKRAAQGVREAMADTPEVLGIHIEGPFLDPARKGAHDPALIRAMTQADEDWLCGLDYREVLLTVAPNKVSPEQIRKLHQAGLHVSLGHAEAQQPDIRAALAAGANCFTHLFNAMSQVSPREPGMAGTALMDASSYVGLITDGFHVHEQVLKLAYALKPHDKMILVTDAMLPAAGGPDHFDLQGRKVEVRNGRLELADGTLAGSNLTMDEAVRFCVERLQWPLEDVLRMASRNPAAFLGLDREMGQIAAGFAANLVALDETLHVKQTWVNGQ